MLLIFCVKFLGTTIDNCVKYMFTFVSGKQILRLLVLT